METSVTFEDYEASFIKFKDDVRMWMEINNTIRQLQGQIRERQKHKNQLTEKITAFMKKYDYEELKINDGRLLVYKTSYVQTPLSQSIVRKRVESLLRTEVPEKSAEMSAVVFQRERMPKHRLSLRRVKVS